VVRLATPRLSIREFVASDFDAVHAYASDPVVTRYLYWGPNTSKQTVAFIDRCVGDQEAIVRENFELAIVLTGSGDLIGGASLMARRLEYREYEIGYCLRSDTWGNGYAKEATRALVAYGFEQLEAHRLYALVDPDNPASMRVIEQLGFVREGLQRSDTLIDGRWCDTLVYAALADKHGQR
jgi:RimJ/RimL family protein N-acetyltransferase